MKALISDAHSIASLECVRSLGKRGVCVVTAGEEGSFPIAAYSRYCSRSLTYPSSSESIDRFVHALLRIIEAERPDVTILATDRTLLPFCRNRDKLSGLTQFVLPEEGAMKTAFDKVATLELAMRLDVPIPRTAFVTGWEDVDRAVATMAPPFVAKPDASHVIREGRVSRRRGPAFIGGKDDCNAFYSRNGVLSAYPILQEWRPGVGVGVSGVFDHGEPCALFSHRRIREEYPLGGRSSYCESVELDDRLRGIALSLLAELGWHGPAMVEFRVGEDGIARLMEINGRLWGSLPLAVAAGVDVPWMLCMLATGGEVAEVPAYAVGRRGRYLLADTNHLISVMRGRPAGWPGPYPARSGALAAFVGAFYREATYFALRREDPLPGLRELARFFGKLPARALGRKEKR